MEALKELLALGATVTFAQRTLTSDEPGHEAFEVVNQIHVYKYSKEWAAMVRLDCELEPVLAQGLAAIKRAFGDSS